MLVVPAVLLVVLGPTVVVVAANWHSLTRQQQMQRPPGYAVVVLDVGPPKKHMLLASINGLLMSTALKDWAQLGIAVINRMSASTLLNRVGVTTCLIDTVLPTQLGHVAAHDAPIEPIIQQNELGTMTPVVVVVVAVVPVVLV